MSSFLSYLARTFNPFCIFGLFACNVSNMQNIFVSVGFALLHFRYVSQSTYAGVDHWLDSANFRGVEAPDSLFLRLTLAQKDWGHVWMCYIAIIDSLSKHHLSTSEHIWSLATVDVELCYIPSQPRFTSSLSQPELQYIFKLVPRCIEVCYQARGSDQGKILLYNLHSHIGAFRCFAHTESIFWLIFLHRYIHDSTTNVLCAWDF
jgi:hypothetical protein